MFNQFLLESDKEKNIVFPKYYFGDDQDKVIQGFSKVNLFIGPNNSGKSMFIRELFIRLLKTDDLLGFGHNDNHIKVKSIPKEIIDEIATNALDILENNVSNSTSISKLSNLKSTYQDTMVSKPKSYLNESEIYNLHTFLISSISDIAKVESGKGENFIRYQHTPPAIQHVEETLNKSLLKFIKIDCLENSYITYIPAFRTLKKFVKKENIEDEDSFKPSGFKYKYIDEFILRERVLRNYYVNADSAGSWQYLIPENRVFSGEDIFDRVVDLYSSGHLGIEKINHFQEFLSVNFFNAKKVNIYAPTKNKQRKELHVKIGEAPDLPISYLGDGIQSIILLTFPLFEIKEDKHYVFIEEPENHLHPKLQRVFLETLLSFPNIQVFITTHSNHFLDISLQNSDKVSIYSFQKQEKEGYGMFHVNNISSPCNNILDILGVRNSSVLLANCTIWVEGISDKTYFRKYLKLYYEEHTDKPIFKEDLHYSFLEYSGDNISHWSFENKEELDKNEQLKTNANSISNRILLIADRDVGKEEKHEKLQEVLDDNYYPLECLEIENLLSPSILKKTLEKYRKKGSNDEIQDFEYDDYKNKPISEFILSKINKYNLKKLVSEKSKKIYDKRFFAKEATVSMEKWNDLSEEAQTLTKKIYEFIKKNNR